MKFFQPLMGRRRGFAWLILLGLPAVLVTAQTLYWQWACRRLDEGARVWMASRNVAGWRLEAGVPVMGGWPLIARLTLPDPVATGPDGVGWTGDRVVLQVRLLHPDRLSVDAPGAQRLMLPKGDRIDFTADRQHLDLPLSDADGSAEYSLSASGISLLFSRHLVFGPTIESLSAAAFISHAGVPLLGAPAPWLRAWRDRNGGVDIRQFALVWGKLDVTGHGTATLDGQLQPAAEGIASVANFAVSIARLADAGVIPGQTASLVTGALTMLSGGSGTAEIPWRLEAGRLSARPHPLLTIPLLTVPAFIWPP